MYFTSGRAYTNEPSGALVEISPFKAVVKKMRRDVVRMVSWMCILVSGAFGMGKDSSIGFVEASMVEVLLVMVFQLRLLDVPKSRSSWSRTNIIGIVTCLKLGYQSVLLSTCTLPLTRPITLFQISVLHSKVSRACHISFFSLDSRRRLVIDTDNEQVPFPLQFHAIKSSTCVNPSLPKSHRAFHQATSRLLCYLLVLQPTQSQRLFHCVFISRRTKYSGLTQWPQILGKTSIRPTPSLMFATSISESSGLDEVST